MRSMELIINGTTRTIYGGPYRHKPDVLVIAPCGTRKMYGVKMAVEIDRPCDIDVPTVDFSVPDEEDYRMGILKGMLLLMEGKQVYVGCWGGIGRTGLYLAGLSKVTRVVNKSTFSPIEDVRNQFNSHAVETDQQMKYIEDFDAEGIHKITKWGKFVTRVYIYIFDKLSK